MAAGSTVTLTDVTFDYLAVNGVATTASELKLVITPHGTNYNFEWTSRPGKVYDLVSATDLSTAPDTWMVYDPDGPGGNDPYGDIPSAGAMTPQLNVPGDGAVRFFAVVERDQPPLLSEDFEGVAGPAAPVDWSTSDNGAGTTWEVGAPSGAATGPDAAANGTQCAGTNIGAAYTASAESSLVTQAFTVPAGGATLGFSHYIDTEDAPSGDLGSIRLLHAADNTPLAGGDVALDLEGITLEWSRTSVPLPAAANGLEVKIEFRFSSDGDSDVFAGFYLDDVVVKAN